METNRLTSPPSHRRVGTLFAFLLFVFFAQSIMSEDFAGTADLKAFAGNDTILGLCGIHSLDATGSSGDIVFYEWKMVKGPKIINILGRNTSNPMFQAFLGGDYDIELLIKDINGNESRDTVHYFFNPLLAEAGGDTTLGACHVLQFNTDSSTLGDGYTFSWYPTDILENSDQTNPSFNPGIFDEGKSFVFYFTVTDSFGCVETDEVRVKVANAPLSDLSNNIVKIGCDSLMLDGSYSYGDDIQYEWYPEDKAQANALAPFFANVSNESTYAKLVITDAYGCKDSSIVDISDEQFFIDAGDDDSIGICENYRIRVEGTVAGNSVQWEPEEWIGNPINPLNVYLRKSLWISNMNDEDASKVFPFVIKIERPSDGCIKRDTLNLTVFNSSSYVSAGEDKTVGVCGAVLDGSVDSTLVSSIYWTANAPLFSMPENQGKEALLNPNVYLGNDYEQRLIAFTLNATDNFGCRVTDRVSIRVDQRPVVSVSPTYYFPNGCDPVTITSHTLRVDSLIWSPGDDLSDIHAEDPVYIGTQDAVLTVKAYDIYGCEDTGEAHVIWSPVLADAGDDVTTKQYQTATVGKASTTSGRFYEWVIVSGEGATLTNTEKDQCRFMSTKEGDFLLELRVRDASGCTVTDQVTVHVEFGKRIPVVNEITISPGNVIQSDSVTIRGDAVSLDGYPLTYTWFLPDETIENGPEIRVQAHFSGWVVLEVFDGFDVGKDSVYWIITPEYPIEALEIVSPMGDTVCARQPMSFSLKVQAEHKERLKYLWWIDDQEPTEIQNITIKTVSSFTIYCKAYNSAESLTDSMRVVVVKPEMIELDDVLACPETELKIAPAFKFPGKDYKYYENQNLIGKSAAPTLPIWNTTDFAFSRENVFGCIDSATLHVDVRPYPVANPDSLLLEELVMMGQVDVATNDVGAVSNYRLISLVSQDQAYLTSDGDFTYNADTTMINGRREFSYKMTSRACPHLSDTAKLTVLLRNAEGLGLIVSNAFSPNGDNVNDRFIIRGITEYLKNELYIYSKIGLLVYEAKPYMNDWDGRRNKGVGIGQDVPEGTYFYVLKVKDDIYLEGTIEIRR